MLQFLLTISDEPNHSKIEYIYDKFHAGMMRYAISRLRNFGRRNYLLEAEDAVQNAFMKITKYINKIKFSRGDRDIQNYCFTILTNEISDILQENFEINEIFEEFCLEKEYNFIEELEIRENYDRVVNAIARLDERYSMTLYLVFCKEMTVGEVAEMMGISPKTVYTRLARGKQLLLDSLMGVYYE